MKEKTIREIIEESINQTEVPETLEYVKEEIEKRKQEEENE